MGVERGIAIFLDCCEQSSLNADLLLNLLLRNALDLQNQSRLAGEDFHTVHSRAGHHDDEIDVLVPRGHNRRYDPPFTMTTYADGDPVQFGQRPQVMQSCLGIVGEIKCRRCRKVP